MLILETHYWLRREMLKLEPAAWEDAHAMTSSQTLRMMSALQLFQKELGRHIKFAEVLVLPFVGQARARGLLKSHLADQSIIARAFGAARRTPGPALCSALAGFEPVLDRLFQMEREIRW